MEIALRHFDTAEVNARKVPEELVVIAGDVDDARAFSCLAQKLLDHVVAGLRPIPAAFETPAVHDIADENDRLRLVVPQEIQGKSVLAAFEPR